MNQISKQAEENSFVVDSLVDLLLTQKITNIKVLKLESDQFHDNVIICTANSLVQMSAIIRNIRKNLQIQIFEWPSCIFELSYHIPSSHLWQKINKNRTKLLWQKL